MSNPGSHGKAGNQIHFSQVTTQYLNTKQPCPLCSCATSHLHCRAAPDVTSHQWGTAGEPEQLVQRWTFCLPSFPTNFFSQAVTQTSRYLISEICQGHCSRLNVWLYGFSSQILCAFSTGKLPRPEFCTGFQQQNCHCLLCLSQETEISSLRTCQLAANQMTIPLYWGTKLMWFSLGKSCFGWLWLLLDQKKSHMKKGLSIKSFMFQSAYISFLATIYYLISVLNISSDSPD